MQLKAQAAYVSVDRVHMCLSGLAWAETRSHVRVEKSHICSLSRSQNNSGDERFRSVY